MCDCAALYRRCFLATVFRRSPWMDHQVSSRCRSVSLHQELFQGLLKVRFLFRSESIQLWCRDDVLPANLRAILANAPMHAVRVVSPRT